MKKKIAAIVLAACMALGMTACGGNKDTQDGNGGSSASKESAKYHVGVCQLVQHEALDAATQGFVDTLKKEFGDEIDIDIQNAQNDSNTCSTIVNSFVSNQYDLIMANATPALQAAAAGTGDIPILATSVTEYGVALGIDDFRGTVGNNISGTSDLAPLDQQAQMIKDLFPEVKTVGILYCSAEANSKYQVDTVSAYLKDMGITANAYAFSDSNDLSTVATDAVNDSDLIYVPTDNTVASNAGIIHNICMSAKVPVIAGEEGVCKEAGAATLSISYYDLGVATGNMAIKVLKGEADITQMPIEYAPEFTKKYNKTICEELGVKVPEDYIAIED